MSTEPNENNQSESPQNPEIKSVYEVGNKNVEMFRSIGTAASGPTVSPADISKEPEGTTNITTIINYCPIYIIGGDVINKSIVDSDDSKNMSGSDNSTQK
jgi:restriction endonuclease S subunit